MQKRMEMFSDTAILFTTYLFLIFVWCGNYLFVLTLSGVRLALLSQTPIGGHILEAYKSTKRENENMQNQHLHRKKSSKKTGLKRAVNIIFCWQCRNAFCWLCTCYWWWGTQTSTKPTSVPSAKHAKSNVFACSFLCKYLVCAFVWYPSMRYYLQSLFSQELG